jgi:multiple sugar transport system substrate-binding protein
MQGVPLLPPVFKTRKSLPQPEGGWRLQISGIVCALLMSILLLPGCSNLFVTTQPTVLQPTPTLLKRTPVTPTPKVTTVPTLSTSNTNKLVLWVPPQFNPTLNTPAAKLLKSRLELFAVQNPGIEIEVRVKAASGDSGLLESLSAAKAAAPGALPSLILLSHSDLEVAALNKLIYPLDKYSKALNDDNWFAFAHQMAEVGGAVYGVPFASDLLILVYRPGKIINTPNDIRNVIIQQNVIAFPAGDSQGLVTLSLYLSLGGKTQDDQGQPLLEPNILGKVLQIYADGTRSGALPAWLVQAQTDSQAWDVFRAGRSDILLTWSSSYFTEKPANTAILPLPSLGSTGYTLADGWLLAITETDEGKRSQCARLIEFLTESAFMAEWTVEAGYLPSRPTALASWKNLGWQSIFSQAALNAHVYPAPDLLTVLGLALKDAVKDVLEGGVDPNQAAQSAFKKLTTPGVK